MGKIYGFGNALMDIEIRISDEELQEIDIPKNTMKHISQDELCLLYTSPSPRDTEVSRMPSSA